MNLQITLHTSAAHLHQMKSDWNELLENSCANTVFLTWEWITTWWEIYGDKYKLYILTIRDSSGILLGIAPFKIAFRRYFLLKKLLALEFIGYGKGITPEYLDVIVRRGYEKTVMPLLLQYLTQHSSCEVYDLQPFASSSPNISFFINSFREEKAYYEKRDCSICPVVYLPQKWNDFVLSKSKNFRKKMKEHERKCERDLNLRFHKCVSLDELEYGMNQLAALHLNRWGRSSRAFSSRKYIEFHKSISSKFYKRDWLRLFFLQNGGEPIAANYCYYYNDEYFYYQSGRDLSYSKYHVGLVLMNKIVEEAINEGATLFDFLSGAEPYKFRWANKTRGSLRIIRWNNSYAYLLSRFSNAAKNMIRKDFDT